MFQDGKVVFVRHGGVFVRVSPNRLCKVNGHISENTTNDNENENGHAVTVPTKSTGNDETQSKVDGMSETLEDLKGTLGNTSDDPESNTSAVVQGHGQTGSLEPDNTLKDNQCIQYKLPDSDEWTTATVLSRAGKVTGRNRHWYNIQDNISNEMKSVDLGCIEWKSLETENEDVHTTVVENNPSSRAAKQTELQKLRQFETYDEVEDHGQSTISTRWVITNKDDTTRARLVARDFEEHSFIPKDSPTVGKGEMRIFLTVCTSKNWSVKTDIKSAILQAKELDRDVYYIKPPIESDTRNGFIWKLKHGLYGLKDGARQFYLSVKDELCKLGCTQSKLDPAVFTFMTQGTLSGIICCHVDDFLHAGDEKFEVMMDKLRDRFMAGKVEELNFTYIGFKIEQTRDGIQLDHSAYVQKLDSPQIDPVRASQKQCELSNNEQSQYRRLVGQLNWAVQRLRPDMAFELVDLSTKLNSASVSDLLRAIKAIGKLKDIRPIQMFPSLHGPSTENWEIPVFVFFPAIPFNFQYTCIISAMLLKVKVKELFSSRKERSESL